MKEWKEGEGKKGEKAEEKIVVRLYRRWTEMKSADLKIVKTTPRQLSAYTIVESVATTTTCDSIFSMLFNFGTPLVRA